MKSRLIILFWLWFVSFVIGLVFSVFMSQKGYISYAGKVVREYQIGNKCIIEIGRFVANVEGKCKRLEGKIVLLSGNPRLNLITAVGGKLDLVSATIDEISVSNVSDVKPEFMESVLGRFLNYCVSLYRKHLPARESALLSGIVFGQKDDIGYDFYQQMVKSGSVHIAVASGFNLMLLAGFVTYPLFYFWKRKIASVVAICFLFLYAMVTGFEPPMIRAWLMISFLFVGLALGRKQEGWWALLISVWVVLVLDMRMVANVSFQLSVAASIGLIVLAPFISKVASERRHEVEVGFLEKSGFLSTFCAMILTTPIIWYHFGRVSFIGLLSNVLILPLVPPVMVLGLLMIVLPAVFYMPTYALLHALVLLIEFFGT